MNKKLRVLREYQEAAVDAMIESQDGLALFLDMGFGKTAVGLHAFLELPKPILIVGPIRVVETVWASEAKDWAATDELTFSIVRGTPKERKEALEKEADVYLTNRELLEEVLGARSFKVLYVDESTLYKNPSTKSFKLLRKHLAKFEKRFIATGTPRPNSLADLWSQIFLVDRGERLGTAFGRFHRKYFYQTDYNGYKFSPHDWAEDEIMELLSDIVFRVSPDTVRTLPPLHNVVEFDLPEKAQKAYTEMEKEAFTEIGKLKKSEFSAATAAIKLMKLRQLASGFAYDDEGRATQVHTRKLELTQEIVEGTGAPVVLVYQFRHELEALQKTFPEGVVFGKTKTPGIRSQDLSDRHKDLWNEGKIPLLFIHPQSGGHGLNLQFGGHVMIIFSGSFSYEQMSQVKKRLDRPGQVAAAVFHYLVAKNTVDNLLMEVQTQKAEDEGRFLELLKGYMDAKTAHNNRGSRRVGEEHADKRANGAPGSSSAPYRRTPLHARGRRKGLLRD